MPARRKANPVPLLEAARPAVAGLDEAGRGPVMGPLVMAGVAVADPDLPHELGCTDSKLLSPDRRRAIDRALRKSAGVLIEVRAVTAEELDAARRQGASLTTIEVEGFQSIACALAAPHTIFDAAHTSESAFAELLRPGLPGDMVISSEHKADLNHPIVGAASIVAKVARDAAIQKLARRLERSLHLPLGSGYASDPLTRAFLREYHAEFGVWPEGTRTTWATVREILAPKPTRLDAFA